MKLCAPILAFLAAGALAAPAGAATVSVSGSTVSIAAPGRETNRITVSARAGGGVTIRDSRTPVVAGEGCTQSRPDRASCGGPETNELVADVGPLNDSLSVSGGVRFPAVLRGGTGGDTLRGGAAGDQLIGGLGSDTVTYSNRRVGVTVTLAGGADDGVPGEGDHVQEIERAVGGTGFDVLIGTDGSNTLTGGPGDDRLDGLGSGDTFRGGSGHDLLQGGDGNDRFEAARSPDGSDALQGGAGHDLADYGERFGSVVVDPDGFADDGDRPGPTLVFVDPLPPLALTTSPERDNVLPDVESVRGGAGADVLAPSNSGGTVTGGPGTDVLYGGPGVDTFAGEGGFDRVAARDGVPEDVRCGTEVDRVYSDAADRVAADCELRGVSVSITVTPLARELDADGLRVRVDCPAQAFVRCAGVLRAATVRRVDGRRRARLGLGGFNLLRGTSAEVVIPFDAEARAIVSRFAPLRVRIAVRGRDDAGPARPSAARLVLRG